MEESTSVILGGMTGKTTNSTGAAPGHNVGRIPAQRGGIWAGMSPVAGQAHNNSVGGIGDRQGTIADIAAGHRHVGPIRTIARILTSGGHTDIHGMPDPGAGKKGITAISYTLVTAGTTMKDTMTLSAEITHSRRISRSIRRRFRSAAGHTVINIMGPGGG